MRQTLNIHSRNRVLYFSEIVFCQIVIMLAVMPLKKNHFGLSFLFRIQTICIPPAPTHCNQMYSMNVILYNSTEATWIVRLTSVRLETIVQILILNKVVDTVIYFMYWVPYLWYRPSLRILHEWIYKFCNVYGGISIA